jgi:hypothetical protein
MQSRPNLDEQTAKEIKANFSVVNSTLDGLSRGLTRSDFVTSYSFISKNIENTLLFIQDGIVGLVTQSTMLENIWTSSPLQISFYRNRPKPIFAYRNAVRTFSDIVRTIVNNLYSNVNKTLASYIFVYETLEKFRLKTPFVLIEGDDFLSADLNNYIFGIFENLGEKPKYRKSTAQVITYSGIDVDDPLSLLIVGHETFHIIDKKIKVFESFCKATGFCASDCCEDAFVDIMSFLYYGPAYTYAVLNHFQKRYPVSGHSHLEMNIRMFILLTLVKTLRKPSLKQEEEIISNFINTLEYRMDNGSKEKAQTDKELLDRLLGKGAIGYITAFFKKYRVTPYDEFLENVETREYASKTERIDRDRILYMLKNNIPTAVRPVILLNTLCETDNIENIDSRLVASSLKKWYVKRYYEKCQEGRRAKDLLLEDINK